MRWGASVFGVGGVLLLAACTAAPAPNETAVASTAMPTSSPTFGLLGANEAALQGCTEIGNAEGVGVDLSQVLSLEGGDYYAEVIVPSLGASSTRGFAGNDGYYPAGDVEADLDGDPVEVRVRVMTERGDVAYEGSGVAQPELFQPNGARCDGENYRISLVATAGGALVPRGDGLYVTDDQGRRTEAVDTQCGVEYFSDGSREWRRVGGVLGDGAGGPPAGWNTPVQRGWVKEQGDGSLLFEDERGHSEQFEPITDGWFPATCG